MVYYNDPSSSNLKPVLLVVSVITAIIFGAGYFAYSSGAHAQSESVEAATPGHSHV